MAQQTDTRNLPLSAAEDIVTPLRPRRKRGRRPKYPWHKWTDGQARRLVLGRDFECSRKSMYNAILRHAKEVEDRAVMVDFEHPDDEDDPWLHGRCLYVQFFPDRSYAEGPPYEE